MEEDGEIFEVDQDQQSDFSMSSYDGENGDILDIKPPQSQGITKERRDKKKERHHRHKGEHSSRHKSDRHRSRSDHRADGRHPRDKKRHRRNKEDRSESSSRRHKEHSSRNIPEVEVEYIRTKEDRSRKREKDHHRSHHERGSSHHLQTMDDYYNFGGEVNLTHEGHNQYSHHTSHRGHHSNYHGSHHNVMPMSPERKKRMERMLAAEKQKELGQKNAESRRQRKEERRVDDVAEGSFDLLVEPTAGHHHERKKKHKKRHRDDNNGLLKYHENVSDEAVSDDDLVMVDLDPADNVVDDYEEQAEELDESKSSPSKEVPAEEEVKESEEDSSDSSSSSSSDSDSSDSDSSDSDEEDKEKKQEEPIEATEGVTQLSSDEELNGEEQKARRSTSSTPVKEENFLLSPGNKSLTPREACSPSSQQLDKSPSKSPTPLKDILPAYFPAIMGCRSVDEFECLNRIAEGTYGVVYRAREKCNDSIVALKRLKMEKEKEGFPITSLREINTLLKGQHSNIVTVREIVVGSNMDKIYIVMDYVEHDLKSLMETMKAKKRHFSIGEVKTLLIQLLRAVNHLHDNWILHRDLKTSNLLLSHTGILKVGDFGLAREYGSPLKQYTPIVVTLWYRAPELLLGSKLYSTAIDVWSVGCIYGELLAMEPIFPGKSEIDQLNRIFKELGTPNESIWTGYNQLPVVKVTQFTEYPYNNLRERFKKRLSDKGFLLLNKFLTYNPSKRITCQEALSHDYFHNEEPVPVNPNMFPTWPAKSEHPQGISAEELNSPKPPSGGKNFKDLGDDDNEVAGFFLGGGRQSGAGFQLKF